MSDSLPPGPRARDDFPRFGLTPYAYRFPRNVDRAELQISGDVLTTAVLQSPLAGLARIEQVSDFHCVTTWSRRSLRWSGVRFADFYRQHIARLDPTGRATTVVLRGQDGYRSTLPLSDLLATDVLLADILDGLPLSLEHGAPLRLIAPAHYGYKSVKHLCRIELWQGSANIRRGVLAFMDHPRARVAHEERGRWLPDWLLRYAYRPLIKSTVEQFAKAASAHAQRK
jgi:DMSO/TMAO reductase YedYZ molybdopterin-dependent catalytic subunit